MYGDMLSKVGAAEKVFCYLDRRPNLPPPGTLEPPSLRGLVEFRDVCFEYPHRPDQPVLKVPGRDGRTDGPLPAAGRDQAFELDPQQLWAGLALMERRGWREEGRLSLSCSSRA